MQRSITGQAVGILSMSAVAPLDLFVKDAGTAIVNGQYIAKNPISLPTGFVKTCDEQGWNSQDMWLKLSNQVSPWWKHKDNDSYIYYNKGDGQWWIDGPSGAGLYVVLVPAVVINNNMAEAKPPKSGWKMLGGAAGPAPSVDAR